MQASNQAWRHHLVSRYRAVEAKIKELEEANTGTDDDNDNDGQNQNGTSEALRSARLETAFLRAVVAGDDKIDIETGWDLRQLKGVLDPLKDGDLEEMAEPMADALGRLVDGIRGSSTPTVTVTRMGLRTVCQKDGQRQHPSGNPLPKDQASTASNSLRGCPN